MPPRKKKALALVCLTLFTTLLTLLLCEAAVRALNLGPQVYAVRHENYQFSDNPLIQYELAPGSAEGDTGLAISADGLRDRDFAPAKPDGVFRIAFIGDSVAYGFGIPRGDSIPKQLEGLLNAQHDGGFEVMNFGVPGYNIKAIAETLDAKVLKYKPDLVIYAYCLNDPQDVSLEFLKLLAAKKEAERVQAERKSGLAAKAGKYGLKRSRLAQLVIHMSQKPSADGDGTRNVRVGGGEDPGNAAHRRGSYAEYFHQIHTGGDERRNLEGSMAKIGRIAGDAEVPVLLLVFPVDNKLDPYPLEEAHGVIAELAVANNLRVYDLLDDFRAYVGETGRGIYFDYLHPDVAGAHYAAQMIFKELMEKYKLYE